MRVSHAELRQTAVKALAGLGVPHGLDDDGASNIIWLELRGLPGCRLLAGEIAASGSGFRWTAPRRTASAGAITLRMPEATGLLLAPGAIDLLHAGESVTIVACRAPLAFVAEAARRSHGARGYRIDVTGAAPAQALCRDGEAALAGPFGSTADTITLRHAGDCDSLPGAAQTSVDLARLRSGFEVDSDLWGSIATAAKRVLVPASTRSRGGAGAEVDDSV